MIKLVVMMALGLMVTSASSTVQKIHNKDDKKEKEDEEDE